jgi:DNA adenine methylase
MVKTLTHAGEEVTRALSPWGGSKRELAKWIVPMFGDHSMFADLTGGSLALLLSKERCRNELVNDLHGDLINLARVVQNDFGGPELFEQLARVTVGREAYVKSCQWLREFRLLDGDGPDLTRAYHYFISTWMGRNGLAGTTAEDKSGLCVRYTNSGGSPATRFKRAVDSIPWWWERLRHVTILREDLFALLERMPDEEGTVVYLDPPYLDKSIQYKHDFRIILDDGDFSRPLPNPAPTQFTQGPTTTSGSPLVYASSQTPAC